LSSGDVRDSENLARDVNHAIHTCASTCVMAWSAVPCVQESGVTVLNCATSKNKKPSYCLETARRESLPKAAEIRCITITSNVLQGHQKWHQSNASARFPISSL